MQGFSVGTESWMGPHQGKRAPRVGPISIAMLASSVGRPPSLWCAPRGRPTTFKTERMVIDSGLVGRTGGRDTSQEDVEESPAQSRMSLSIYDVY